MPCSSQESAEADFDNNEELSRYLKEAKEMEEDLIAGKDEFVEDLDDGQNTDSEMAEFFGWLSYLLIPVTTKTLRDTFFAISDSKCFEFDELWCIFQ